MFNGGGFLCASLRHLSKLFDHRRPIQATYTHILPHLIIILFRSPFCLPPPPLLLLPCGFCTTFRMITSPAATSTPVSTLRCRRRCCFAVVLITEGGQQSHAHIYVLLVDASAHALRICDRELCVPPCLSSPLSSRNKTYSLTHTRTRLHT